MRNRDPFHVESSDGERERAALGEERVPLRKARQPLECGYELLDVSFGVLAMIGRSHVIGRYCKPSYLLVVAT